MCRPRQPENASEYFQIYELIIPKQKFNDQHRAGSEAPTSQIAFYHLQNTHGRKNFCALFRGLWLDVNFFSSISDDRFE